MKLRNKLTAITAAAMLAFTGVGFAAWTFTNSVTAPAQTIGSGVTAAIQAESVSVDATTLYLICDAPSGVSGLTAGNDIYWSTSKENDTNKAVSSVKLTGKVTEDGEDIVDFNKYTGHFTMTFTAPSSNTYVTFAESNTSADVVVNSTNGNCEYTYTLPKPSYTNTSLFTNVAAVTAMKDSLTGMAFTFTFNVASVSKA